MDINGGALIHGWSSGYQLLKCLKQVVYALIKAIRGRVVKATEFGIKVVIPGARDLWPVLIIFIR